MTWNHHFSIILYIGSSKQLTCHTIHVESTYAINTLEVSFDLRHFMSSKPSDSKGFLPNLRTRVSLLLLLIMFEIPNPFSAFPSP